MILAFCKWLTASEIEFYKILLIANNSAEICGRNDRLSLSELEDFRREFPSVKLTLKTAGGVMHDRYIVLDYGAATEKIYHCGASSKDGGNKMTTIALVNDNVVYHPLIDSLLGNPEMVLK